MDAPETAGVVIVYVDENENARKDFFSDAFFSEKFSDILVLPPRPTLHEMVEELLSYKFDALISDFRLADASVVDYDGSQLVASFLAIRKEFPCFIRTSFDDDALHVVDDVNRVYSKLENNIPGRSIFDRIVLQVIRQRQKLEASLAELENLMAGEPAAMTPADVDRIVELDSYVEAYLGADHQAAVQLKKSVFMNGLKSRQSDLIAETELLIRQIKGELDAD
jgi:hypothetical protein